MFPFFYYMQSYGVWRLVPRLGQEKKLGEIITSSMTRLQSAALGAEIDQEFFELISGRKGREELRAALLNIYFAPDVRQLLLREAVENQEAFEYSQRLLQTAEAAMSFGQPDKPQQVRDLGFRKAIMNLYNHRCPLRHPHDHSGRAHDKNR